MAPVPCPLIVGTASCLGAPPVEFKELLCTVQRAASRQFLFMRIFLWKLYSKISGCVVL